MEDKQYTEDEAMKVLLTPESYEKWKKKSQSQDNLKAKIELTDAEMAEIGEQLSDPLRASDSKVANWIKDLLAHPEKSKWYRDHVLFPTTEERFFPDKVDDNPNEWKVEIPIISTDF